MDYLAEYDSFDLAEDLFQMQGNAPDAISIAEDIPDEDLREEVISILEDMGEEE